MRLSLSLTGLAAIASLVPDVNAVWHDACACHNGGEYNWRMTVAACETIKLIHAQESWANQGSVYYDNGSGRCSSSPSGKTFVEGGDMNMACKLGRPAPDSIIFWTRVAPSVESDTSNITVEGNAPYMSREREKYIKASDWPICVDWRVNAVDYFIHLGDYIYEDEHGIPGRDERALIPPREIIVLHNYRTRHGQYRTDEDLLLAHRMFPWIPVWDDHDLINNGWRDGGSSVNNTEASLLQQGGVSFDQRKMNAVRAYYDLRIWRAFRLGNLVDLTMLDTRHYDRSITRVGPNEAYVQRIADDAGRSMLGSHQENWFFRQLSESHARGTTWRVVGNQMIFSRMTMTASTNRLGGFDVDAWDGYLATWNRTLERIYDEGVVNVIMLAGDSHQSWVSDLAWFGGRPYNGTTGEGAVGVEFAVTAVSSDGLDGTTHEAEAISRAFLADNEELQWQEGHYRGYLEVRFGRDRLDAAFYGCPTVRDRNALDLPVANFTVFAGENHLARPVGGGRVEAGALRGGEVQHSNVSLDMEKGEWVFAAFDEMFIAWAVGGGVVGTHGLEGAGFGDRGSIRSSSSSGPAP